jgi:hypothetical protein
MKDQPSGSDRNKASNALPMLDEVLAIAPSLEANWPAEAAATPPGTLVCRVEPGVPPAAVEPGGEGGPGGGTEPGSEEDFLDSFDLDSVPPEARPAVEALQKDWQGKYTQRRQAESAEVAEARREAEQSQALIQGLRDPSTMPHYLQLMGIDLSDPQTLELLGVQAPARGGGEVDDELRQLLEDGGDEDELEARLATLEGERQTEKQEREAQQVEDALDELADTELEKIEGEWGRKLDDYEDTIIRQRAEASPGPDGLPDYESAATLLKSWLASREQSWAEQRSQPGRGAPGGRPGGKALDVNKDEDRAEIGLASAEAALASLNND